MIWEALPGKACRRGDRIPAEPLATGQRNGLRHPDHREEPTMTNLINNATAALIILGLAITSLSMFGAVIAGALGA